MRKYMVVISDAEAYFPCITRYGAYLKLARVLRKVKLLTAEPHGYVINDRTGEVLIFMNR